MYSYFRGELVDRDEAGVVVECAGVGYDIQMGPFLAAALGNLGATVTCYAHFHISQDNQQIFGFPDQETRKLFRLLITVNGIGPKVALSVLEVYSPAAFAIHVMNNDAKALQNVKGLGKKSAERIILELRDKLAKGAWGAEVEAFLKTDAGQGDSEADAHSQMQTDVLEGLAYLGYAPNDAKKLLKASFDPSLSLEDNLRAAMACGRQS